VEFNVLLNFSKKNMFVEVLSVVKCFISAATGCQASGNSRNATGLETIKWVWFYERL